MNLITIVHPRKEYYIPIIYEFLSDVDKYILCYDKESEDERYADEIQKSIKKVFKKYNLSIKVDLLGIDEDSKQDMKKVVYTIREKYPNSYLNGAGADTALFTVLSSAVLRNGGKVIAYDINDNSYNLITKSGFENFTIKNSMNIDDYVTLMSDEIISETSSFDILQRKDALFELYSDAKVMFKIRELLQRKEIDKLKNSYGKIFNSLKILGLVDKNYNITGEEAYTNFGRYFEEFLYLHTKEYDFDDIKIGVIIRFDQTQVSKKEIKIQNEFDILTIKDNKIGFIESKIGNTVNPLNTIYKSDSVMEYFGQSAKSMIVNIQIDKTPHLKSSQQNFTKWITYRANTKNITIYNAFDFGTKKYEKKLYEAFGVKKRENLHGVS